LALQAPVISLQVLKPVCPTHSKAGPSHSKQAVTPLFSAQMSGLQSDGDQVPALLHVFRVSMSSHSVSPGAHSWQPALPLTTAQAGVALLQVALTTVPPDEQVLSTVLLEQLST
jgi:hypothetical protein